MRNWNESTIVLITDLLDRYHRESEYINWIKNQLNTDSFTDTVFNPDIAELTAKLETVKTNLWAIQQSLKDVLKTIYNS